MQAYGMEGTSINRPEDSGRRMVTQVTFSEHLGYFFFDLINPLLTLTNFPPFGQVMEA
jgi:hypothetical protein